MSTDKELLQEIIQKMTMLNDSMVKHADTQAIIVQKVDDIEGRISKLEFSEDNDKNVNDLQKKFEKYDNSKNVKMLDDLYIDEELEIFPTKTKFRDSKRKSLIEIENQLEKDDSDEDKYIKTYPNFDHIKLESFTLKNVDKFFEDIRLFETKHKIKINVSVQIKKSVMLSLISTAREYNYKMSETLYYGLKLESIAKLARLHFKPTDKHDFDYKLSRNITFPEMHPKYEISIVNFGPFHAALLIYRESFERIYDFLSLDNMENVPSCNNKKGGIVAAFIGKIPHKYGELVLQAIGRQRFESVKEMLDGFYKEVEKHRRISREARPLYLNLNSAKKDINESKQSGSSERLPSESNYKKNLNNMFEDNNEEIIYMEENEELNQVTYDEEVTRVNKIQTQTSSAIPLSENKNERGCIRQLFTSDCPSGSRCKYSHDEKILREMWRAYNKGLNTSKYGPKLQTLVQTDSIYLVQDALHNVIPNYSLLKAVYREGQIILGDQHIYVGKALFDSGALSSDYIDENFVNKHREQMKPYLKQCNIQVKMADNSTIVEVKEVATLKIRFEREGQEYVISSDFSVLKMNGGNEVIIGLPTIVLKLGYLFQHMLEDAMDSLCTVEEHESFQGDTLNITDCPEEISTPMPCAFPNFLYFTSMNTQEAREKYESLFDTHVDPEFKSQTNVIDLLRTKGSLVFIPQNWDGIKGLEPLELEFKEKIPRMKPPARPVNPILFENAKNEFERLKTYMYYSSNSDVASPLVIAPKATKPYIRFCGDYTKINKYIVTGHFPIPNVVHEIQKLIKYKIFLDIDMRNAFHQIKLGPITSEMLSIQTVWGQVAPKFLQEGVGPATGKLQQTVVEIFRDFDWMLVVFDNFLVGAHDYQDAFKKLEIVLDRCIERNIFCNFDKSWLGFKEVNFFGYKCSCERYEITEERKQSINAIPFPDSVKSMQRFLGMVLFCSHHIENYVNLVSPLHDMTHKQFNWDESTWTRDYRKDFENVKAAILKAVALYYPDYSLNWILKPDASDIGVGGLLLQERKKDDGGVQQELIATVNQKFSGSARAWSTIKKEAYAVFYTVKVLEYYLRGKEFVILTDHSNLRFMEASKEPIIMRWWSFLQGFNLTILYDKGKHNFVADFFSRLQSIVTQEPEEPACWYSHCTTSGDMVECVEQLFTIDMMAGHEDTGKSLTTVVQEDQSNRAPEYYLMQVHGGRMGHHGASRTWKLLNSHFEGHRIPYRIVQEYVASCAVCQKDRLGMTSTIKPTIRHLKPEHARSRMGMDLLTVTPVDKNGNNYIHVIGNHFTHHVGLYPSKEKTAYAAAAALFQHICLFGMTDEIIMDPASDHKSEVMAHLLNWLGIRAKFSLVDRHESNGVECPSKQVLHLLRNLVYDERIIHRWSDNTVLPLIVFMLNDFVHSETGYSPMELTFGSLARVYAKISTENFNVENKHNVYLRHLEEDLKHLRVLSKQFQTSLVEKRTRENPSRPNEFQQGDLILFLTTQDKLRPTKLTPAYSGPYKVISQRNNDVECRHIVGDFIRVFHVSRIKLFHGTEEEAYRIALLDNDQYVINRITAYRGEPLTRTTMSFEVHFEVGSIVWLPWSTELSDTIQFEEFCRKSPELQVLLFNVKQAEDFVKRKKGEKISLIQPGDMVFVDIRSYGATWYQDLKLPHQDYKKYVVEYRYLEWANKKQTKIKAYCEIFNETFILDGYFVFSYGAYTDFRANDMVLIDEYWIGRFPDLLPKDRK